jgi:hypothetical protein
MKKVTFLPALVIVLALLVAATFMLRPPSEDGVTGNNPELAKDGSTIAPRITAPDVPEQKDAAAAIDQPVSTVVKAITPLQLFKTLGATTGRPLDLKSAAFKLARIEGRKPEGQTTRLDRKSLDGIAQWKPGDTINLPLTDRENVAATVHFVHTPAAGVRSVIGGLEGKAGGFSIQCVSGHFQGDIKLLEEGLAYRIDEEQAGDMVLHEVPLSEVICAPDSPEAASMTADLQTSGGTFSRSPVPKGISEPAPILNSRPSATIQFYLNFNGETVSGTAWNSEFNTGNPIVAAPAGLTAAQITTVFNEVAEYYRPFNVNVTTELANYNAAATNKRMKCVITPTNTAGGGNPGVGGIAYLGDFGNPAGSGVCWGFTHNVPDFGISGVAVSVAHELGHTLNLNHDGPGTSENPGYFTGHGQGTVQMAPPGYTQVYNSAWGPVMGSPTKSRGFIDTNGVTSYARARADVVQWSKGEYASPDNTEDDLTIIAQQLGYVADEDGGTLGAAPPLLLTSGTTVNQSGIISSSTDADLYRFRTAGGSVTLSRLNILGDRGTCLHGALQILDRNGAVIASDDPTAMYATITSTLGAGLYYVKVFGTGRNNPLTNGYTSYGSIGAYTLGGTINGALNIAAGDFEDPATTYVYTPAVTATQPWTFSTGTAGISNNIGFGVSGAATGQFAFIQNSGSSISQSMYFRPGNHQLFYRLASRSPANGTTSYSVSVSGGLFAVNGSTTSGQAFAPFGYNFVVPTAGNYTITFANTTPAANGDQTYYVDSVQVYNVVGPPVITTPSCTSITASAATLGGNVTSDGDGSALIERGVVYALTATNPNPVIGGAGVTKIAVGRDTGQFTTRVETLSAARGYSFKAYATSSLGTTYTSTLTFTTAVQVPTVTTPTQSNITAISATLGGNVTSDGGATITERGIVYSENFPLTIGSVGVTKVIASGTSTGVFTANATSLVPGTYYFYAAYAINSAGTAYSNSDYILTAASTSPQVNSPTSTSITSTSATLGGNVTSDGGAAITERGVVYALTSANATPAIGGTGVTKVTASGTTGVFTANVTSLTGNRGYSFRAYAINSVGTTYSSSTATFTTAAIAPTVTTLTLSGLTATSATLGGNVASDGGAAITERGVVYALTSANATPAIGGTGVTKVTASGTTGVFTAGVTSLTGYSGYSFRAYAINSVGTTYSSSTATFTTAAIAPTVTTPTLSNITATSATLGGNVASDGGAAITERGVVYALTSANAAPAIGGTGVTKVTASGTTGVFTAGVTSLIGNSGYSFRAYAINSVGTTYTSVDTFITLVGRPVVTQPTSATVTGTSAVLGGNIISTSGATLGRNGIAYAPTATNSDPQIGGSGVMVILGSSTADLGVFAIAVTDLTPGTAYSFRPLVTSSAGVGSSATVGTFLTPPISPIVTAPTVAAITSGGATLGGNVTATGGNGITAVGVVFAPTSVNANPQLGGVGVSQISAAGSTGAFTRQVTGLVAGTQYSYRAFATNDVGTGYSTVDTFSTSAPNAQADMATWAAGFGVSGTNANPASTPFNDGVSNLLKYAFNMPLTGPNVSYMIPVTGVGGLPSVTTTFSGGSPTSTRVEFIRRRNSGLIYNPQYSVNGLSTFMAMTAPPVVSIIDATWERVVVEQAFVLPLPSTCFSRVSVTAP